MKRNDIEMENARDNAIGINHYVEKSDLVDMWECAENIEQFSQMLKDFVGVSKYRKAKAKVRQKAIEWQLAMSDKNYSWWDIAHIGERFEKLGRRYGLLKEFRANGII